MKNKLRCNFSDCRRELNKNNTKVIIDRETNRNIYICESCWMELK